MGARKRRSSKKPRKLSTSLLFNQKELSPIGSIGSKESSPSPLLSIEITNQEDEKKYWYKSAKLIFGMLQIIFN